MKMRICDYRDFNQANDQIPDKTYSNKPEQYLRQWYTFKSIKGIK